VGASRFHGFVAAFRIDLLHDAVQMILHGEFREVEFAGDFLVGQSAGDERNQLLLPDGEAGPGIGTARRFASFVGYPFEQR